MEREDTEVVPYLTPERFAQVPIRLWSRQPFWEFLAVSYQVAFKDVIILSYVGWVEATKHYQFLLGFTIVQLNLLMVESNLVSDTKLALGGLVR